MSIYVDIYKKLDNFELNVKFECENEVLSLFGASGCGKSMTLKCIAGIERPDRGKIVLNGRVLFDSEAKIDLCPQKRNVGYLFQQYALFPNMTVKENILMGIRDDSHDSAGKKIPKKSKEEKLKTVNEMISAMELTGLENKYPNQLSGGQQQRTALARILVNNPDVLLLDEPFSALDTHLRFQMEKEVKEVIRSYGHPVIFVTHDRSEVYRLSDRIAVIDEGKILTLTERAKLFRNPETVKGARLVGINNISVIKPVNENRVYAEDFGTELIVGGDISEITHIGIPEHHMIFGEELDKYLEDNRYAENVIRCDVINEIENPDSIILSLRPEGSDSGNFEIKVDRFYWKRHKNATFTFQIMPKGIRLLKDK